MVQVPAARPVTVEPLTEQMFDVILVNATGKPEVELAVEVVVPLISSVLGENSMALMVCVCSARAKVAVTLLAAVTLLRVQLAPLQSPLKA